MERKKVLEVACGYGYVTENVLTSYFYEIDMFDHCPYSIRDVKLRLSKEPKINDITQCTMETFEWKSHWNCIVFRYCVNYLNDLALIKVL